MNDHGRASMCRHNNRRHYNRGLCRSCFEKWLAGKSYPLSAIQRGPAEAAGLLDIESLQERGRTPS